MTYFDCGSSYSRMVELLVPETLRLEDLSVLSTAARDGGTDGNSSPPIMTPGSEFKILTYSRSFLRSLFNSLMACCKPLGTLEGPRPSSPLVTVEPSPTSSWTAPAGSPVGILTGYRSTAVGPLASRRNAVIGTVASGLTSLLPTLMLPSAAVVFRSIDLISRSTF